MGFHNKIRISQVLRRGPVHRMLHKSNISILHASDLITRARGCDTYTPPTHTHTHTRKSEFKSRGALDFDLGGKLSGHFVYVCIVASLLRNGWIYVKTGQIKSAFDCALKHDMFQSKQGYMTRTVRTAVT